MEEIGRSAPRPEMRSGVADDKPKPKPKAKPKAPPKNESPFPRPKMQVVTGSAGRPRDATKKPPKKG